MDEAEREFRNARAIGCFHRVKNAIMGTAAILLGLVIPAWLMTRDPNEASDPGPWPWVALVACWLIGPLLLWQAFRRSPPRE